MKQLVINGILLPFVNDDKYQGMNLDVTPKGECAICVVSVSSVRRVFVCFAHVIPFPYQLKSIISGTLLKMTSQVVLCCVRITELKRCLFLFSSFVLF